MFDEDRKDSLVTGDEMVYHVGGLVEAEEWGHSYTQMLMVERHRDDPTLLSSNIPFVTPHHDILAHLLHVAALSIPKSAKSFD